VGETSSGLTDQEAALGLLEAPRELSTADPTSLQVLLAAPRGFCAGVRRAIEAVRDAIAVHGAPVYVRRAIVHNLDVVRSLESEGAVFIEELSEAPEGAVVLFSAHGVAPAVAQEAAGRGLRAFDAVCPLVSKVHREVERHERHGRITLLIGHRGHPEIAGTLGHVASGSAFVVSSPGEVKTLQLADDRPVAYAVQTTYSVDDAAEIIAALRQRFSDLVGPRSSDICYATTNRQAAAREIALRSRAVIVVGDEFSSNACRLAEVAASICGSVQRVANKGELDWSLIPGSGTVGITAAASTPESAVQDVVDALAARYSIKVDEVQSASESTIFKRLAVV
jgi:4-hydroxy-3-methylbut-2-enyl diphosphate reductase